MRNHVIDRLYDLAQTDERIMLIVGDLGYSVVEKFRDSFGNRYLNAGISEQNMTGVAAGLAHDGHVVFTYSIGNFPTLRCIEQIRNDVCYHNLNVKIVAVGGGFAYGDLGMTHHATEDIAMMRALPNMRVYVPGDAIEAVLCLEEAYRKEGPAYIRLARGKESLIHSNTETLDITKPVQIKKKGKDINILTCGTVASEGIQLYELLKDKYDTGLFAVPTVKPLDRETITELANESKMIVTVEEHNVIGGLGGAVSEIMAELPQKRAFLRRYGLQDVYTEVVGDQLYLRDYYGLSGNKMYLDLQTLLKE